MNFIKKKPIVLYLAYEPLGFKYLDNFIKNYNIFSSGYDHDLVICFKNFQNNDLIKSWENQIKINYTKFDDSNQKNDYDIGSYFRVANKYYDRHILFLGTYTKPIVNNWLKIFINHYSNKTILGAMANYGSISSQFLNFEYLQFTKFQQFRWGLKHFLNFKLFPNPHIKTTAFFIKSEDILNLNFNTSRLTDKIYNNYFESGRGGLSNKLIKKGFKLLLVNSDNKSFEILDWPKSETFCLGNQKKLIFSDNYTENYFNCNLKEKNKLTKLYWGKL